jgi:hypothetical protein
MGAMLRRMGTRLYESDDERREIIKELRSMRTKHGETVFPIPETLVAVLMVLFQEANKDIVLEVARKHWGAW